MLVDDHGRILNVYFQTNKIHYKKQTVNQNMNADMYKKSAQGKQWGNKIEWNAKYNCGI